MSEYIFEIGLFCFSMTLVGVLLTIREFREIERRAVERQRAKDTQESHESPHSSANTATVQNIRSA